MIDPQPIEITASQATTLLHDELLAAALALEAAEMDAAYDAYVRGLGLALQLGPEPAEEALRAVLNGARDLVQRGDALALATLGPAVAGLVDQVRAAGALPANPVMEAWAAVAAEIGVLVGQWGLAISLPAEHRLGLFARIQDRAALLDAATNSLFDLAAWPQFPDGRC